MAKVKRRKSPEMLEAKTGPMLDLPTLAQSIEMRDMQREQMPTIKLSESAPQLKAKEGSPYEPMLKTRESVAAPSLKAKVSPSMKGMKSEKSGDNIYDPRIGGYGRAMKSESGMWKETGEQAVKRILKAKVKKKGK